MSYLIATPVAWLTPFCRPVARLVARPAPPKRLQFHGRSTALDPIRVSLQFALSVSASITRRCSTTVALMSTPPAAGSTMFIPTTVFSPALASVSASAERPPPLVAITPRPAFPDRLTLTLPREPRLPLHRQSAARLQRAQRRR